MWELRKRFDVRHKDMAQTNEPGRYVTVGRIKDRVRIRFINESRQKKCQLCITIDVLKLEKI